MPKLYLLLLLVSAAQLCRAQSFYQNPKPTGADLHTVHFVNNDRGFTGGDDGLFKTTDGGMNWWRVKVPPDSIKEIFFLDENTGWYGGSRGEIYKTSDSGESWELYSVINGYSISSLFFHSIIKGFAGTSAGTIFRTTDGGINWTKSVPGGERSNITSIFFTSAMKGWAGEDHAKKLWYTTDAGEVWQIKGAPGSIGSTTQEIFFPQGGDTGYACGLGNAIKTTNGGTNWFGLSVVPQPHKPQFFNVYFLDHQNGWLLSRNTEFGNLFKTSDGGLTWESSFLRFELLRDIVFPSDSVGYITGDYGLIAKTTNGGESWTILTRGTWKNFTESFFYNEDKGWAIGHTENVIGIYVYENVIVKTTDGGKNWIEIPSPYFQFYQSMFFASGNTGWITALGGILKTTDGGDNWFPLNVPFQIYRGIYFLDEKVGWTVGQNGVNIPFEAILMYTSDGGETWTDKKIFQDYSNRFIWFINEQTGFMDWGGGVYKTTDGGLNWQYTILSNDHVIRDIYFIKDSVGFMSGRYFASANSFVAKTTDQGASWQIRDKELLWTGNKIEFVDENNGFVIGSNLYFTTDQGLTWIHSNEYGNSVSFVSKDAGWMFGNNGVIKKFTSALTAVEDQDVIYKNPGTYYLSQNYPNPFNPSTTINYTIPRESAGRVTLTIFDILGNEIAELVNDEKPAGEYSVEWNGAAYASGVYFLRMHAGGFATTIKLLLMK